MKSIKTNTELKTSKIITFLLCAVCILCTPVALSAAPITKTVHPFKSYQVSLTIDATGKANIKISAQAASKRTAMRAAVTLQKKNENLWTDVKSWSGSGTGSIRLSKKYTVSDGSYRIRAALKSGAVQKKLYSKKSTYKSQPTEPSDDPTTSSNQIEADGQISVSDHPAYNTASDLINASDLVFTGTVESIQKEMLNVRHELEKDSATGLEISDSLPYIVYTIRVSTVYKGMIETDTIRLKHIDTSMTLSADPILIAENSSYLFTAAAFEHSYASLLYASDLKQADEASGNDTITPAQIIALFEQS